MSAVAEQFTRLPLRYFIDYFPTRPGFVDIVLENNDKVYVQVVGANGTVCGFEEVDVEESIHISAVPSVEPAIVGHQAWYGFRNRNGDVIIRQWEGMRTYLNQTFRDYSDMTFLSYEIAEFLEDEEKQAACADMIMRKRDLFDLSSQL
jgi:hypothetical protein